MLREPQLVIVDIRWVHGDPQAGRAAFENSHIPGAIFLDMDTELSDRTDLRRGRHPLPDPERFARLLAERGIGANSKVVVYDDAGGSLAARLWWMLRWAGGPAAQLLDGGFAAWLAGGKPAESGPGTVRPAAARWAPDPRGELIADKAEIAETVRRGAILIEARAEERYRGEIEPIDRRAGHIPGAANVPWAENLRGDPPLLRDAKELRDVYLRAGAGSDREIICYCGSGVTSCLNVLALDEAGFTRVRLYPGSWSEWIADAP